MTLFQDYSALPSGKAILLSVKPKYADLITAGTKLVELRRSWPSQQVGMIAIYSTSPVKSIVAIVDVEEIVKASPSRIWTYARDYGGGLTKGELKEYLSGKKEGYAVLLKNVRVFSKPINPTKVIEDFTAPQGFRYLAEKELQKLLKELNPETKK